MKNFIAATFVLTTFALLGVGCTAGPIDPDAIGDDGDGVSDDEESVGEAEAAVAPGCYPNVNCNGTKTCQPWSAYTACGASFQTCHPDCGFVTRSGCNVQGTVTPENRSRSCVMKSTGQTCVETDYREVLISCPY